MAVPDEAMEDKATDAEDVEAAETEEEEAGQTDADIREETSQGTTKTREDSPTEGSQVSARN